MNIPISSLSDAVDIYCKYRKRTSCDIENLHQGELTIVKLVLGSSCFSDSEKAEVLLLGSHQHHISKSPVASTLIGKIETERPWDPAWISGLGDFDDLLHKVTKSFRINPNNGFGYLTQYDVALRLAYFHSPALMPTKVYLYGNGPINAARILNGVAYKLPCSIPVSSLPAEFHTTALAPHEVEDALCVLNGCLALGSLKPGATLRIDMKHVPMLFSAAILAKLLSLYPNLSLGYFKVKA